MKDAPNFDIAGQAAVVTGAAGVLCAAMCRALAEAGVRVAVLDLRLPAAAGLAEEIGGGAIAAACDVLNRDSLDSAARRVAEAFGRVDILINGAGGNNPLATTGAEGAFFDLPVGALRQVVDLNLMGAILPSQIFGRFMAAQQQGVILNIASMNALRPLTRVPAYSAAKAGVANFTQWLAVHMAREYSPNIRVNALAPGFFLTEQNRFLLMDEAGGGLTPRGRQIIDHTPQGRFGAPNDLLGTMRWLVSPAASFVTGVVVPVDGGFSAFSGV
jgi:NAD(P)-dependent dehydrogenase (short-subunit alcohol dehydrogenase family)